jgi:hypothetical protein
MSEQFAQSFSNFTGEPLGPIMQNTVSESNSIINSVLKPIVENSPIMLILKLSMILYGAFIAPQLSSKFAPFISNPFFRVAMLSLMAWVYSKDPTLSILIGCSYYLTITYLTKNSVKEVEDSGEITPEIIMVLEETPAPVTKVVPLATIPVPIVSKPQQVQATGLLSATGELIDPTFPPKIETEVPQGNIPEGVTELAEIEIE